MWKYTSIWNLKLEWISSCLETLTVDCFRFFAVPLSIIWLNIVNIFWLLVSVFIQNNEYSPMSKLKNTILYIAIFISKSNPSCQNRLLAGEGEGKLPGLTGWLDHYSDRHNTICFVVSTRRTYQSQEKHAAGAGSWTGSWGSGQECWKISLLSFINSMQCNVTI